MEWSSPETVTWVQNVGQPALAEQVEENELDAADLAQLSAEELAELGGGHGVWEMIHGGGRPGGDGPATTNTNHAQQHSRFKPGFDVEQVCEWMEAQGYGDYAETILDEELSGEVR